MTKLLKSRLKEQAATVRWRITLAHNLHSSEDTLGDMISGKTVRKPRFNSECRLHRLQGELCLPLQVLISILTVAPTEVSTSSWMLESALVTTNANFGVYSSSLIIIIDTGWFDILPLPVCFCIEFCSMCPELHSKYGQEAAGQRRLKGWAVTC